jgi:RNA polymerase sigma-70 factor (ECF subfamily)
MEETETSIFLKQWNQGDRNALEDLLERHLSWIRARVRKRLGPFLRKKGESCDYVQEAVVQFLQYGPRIAISDDGQFRALLCKIVENTLCNQYEWFMARRREIARERPLPTDTVLSLDLPQAQVGTPSQSAARHEQEAWVRLGIELVSPEDREVLVLREWDRLSFKEIGKHLGIPSGTAQVRHFRALSRLSDTVGAIRRGNLKNLVQEDSS